jgi:hypothetical protein
MIALIALAALAIASPIIGTAIEALMTLEKA